MPNSVFVKKNIIREIYDGDQTYETIHQISNQLEEKVIELKKKNKEAKVLIDLSKMGNTTTGARRASVEVLKHIEYDKIAFIGGSNYVRHLVNFVIRASGKTKKVKVFTEEKDAKNWFKQKQY